MPFSLRYKGKDRWSEQAITGSPQMWLPGQGGEVADQYAAAFMATGLFEEFERTDIFEQNGKIVTTSGAQVGGGVAQLVGASRVRTMLAAIRRGGRQRVNLGFHGHSIVQGVGSDSTTNTNYASAQIWRQQSMAAMLSRALNGAVGGTFVGGGESLVLPQNGMLTAVSGALQPGNYGIAGPQGYVLALTNATDTADFIAEGSAVRIYGYASGAGVVARYQINGGAVTNATAAPNTPTGAVVSGNTLVWYDVTITGLTPGDTVRLVGPASGGSANNYRVYLIDPNYVTTPGVTVHRLASAGQMGPQVIAAYLDDTDKQPGGGAFWVAPGRADQRAMQTDSVTTRLGVAGVLNMFCVNDIKAYNFAGQAWGWTLETLERHMRNYLTAMDAREIPVVLCLGPLRNPEAADTAGTPYTQADIIDLYKHCADTSNSAAYIDLSAEFTGATLNDRYAVQQATGLIQDAVHPNAEGAAYYGAQRIANALLSA